MSDADNSGERVKSSDSPVADRVLQLLAPVVATADVELLDVEWTGGTLRLVIDEPEDRRGVVDEPEDRRGVTTAKLAAVNRLVSPILDQHDPVPGRYTLEVSSPGVERPLRRLEHYRRAIGEDVVLKLVPDVGPRRLRGGLRSVDEEHVVVEVVEMDGVDLDQSDSQRIDIAHIKSARTVFDWSPTPKKGSKGSKRKKKGASQTSARTSKPTASAPAAERKTTEYPDN